jgi:hypothetical protein
MVFGMRLKELGGKKGLPVEYNKQSLKRGLKSGLL